ncbi:MAG: hypothetical protein ABIK62_05825 [candidate division WOR-3 bacterium]
MSRSPVGSPGPHRFRQLPQGHRVLTYFLLLVVVALVAIGFMSRGWDRIRQFSTQI